MQPRGRRSREASHAPEIVLQYSTPLGAPSLTAVPPRWRHDNEHLRITSYAFFEQTLNAPGTTRTGHLPKPAAAGTQFPVLVWYSGLAVLACR